jgi:UPF0176 protein
MQIVVATFYHFFDFPHFAAMREPLLAKLNDLGLKGSLLVAGEGINATIAGKREAVDSYLAFLKEEVTHSAFEHKESFTDMMPFKRSKVRLKKETISLGEKVSPLKAGTYVSAEEWNALIGDPDVVVIDTRNSYETHLGTFKGALDPKTRSFKELPDYVRKHLADAKQKKIATFCTGGIRCEKFTAWMQQEGYENVYHLKGGILKYLEVMPQEESLWQGECYVFDERVAVGHGLTPTQTATACPACGHTLKEADRAHADYKQGEACPFCATHKTQRKNAANGMYGRPE